MSDDPLYHQLLDESWRRRLSPEEQRELLTWLAAHPELETEWESELKLSQAFANLPPAPVPSNFTARVLQEIQTLEKAAARARTRARWWRLSNWGWAPRGAFAALLLGGTVLTYHHSRVVSRQRALSSVEVVSNVASRPSPDVLRDFDAIQALNAGPGPDETLLTLFQ